MQAISNPYGYGRDQVHFEAPLPDRLDAEISAVLDWLNSSSDLDLVPKSALAHLWFVMIHPFDDGNGRIARAIVDLTLARSGQNSLRFYSMSSQIQREHAACYMILEQTQKGTLDVTDWLRWYLGYLGRAIDAAATTLAAMLAKSRFRDVLRNVPLNDRQRLMLNKPIDGFEGKLTTGKWAKIARTSKIEGNGRRHWKLIERQADRNETAAAGHPDQPLPFVANAPNAAVTRHGERIDVPDP